MKKSLLCIALVLILLCSFTSALAAGPYKKNYQLPYQVGDRMDDFRVTLSDGSTVSLYQLLSEKEIVLINFWASWCHWCLVEFPFMEEACSELGDRVGFIALSIESGDTDETIAEIKSSNGLNLLPMGRDTIGLSDRFFFSGIPFTVLVGQKGVILSMEEGAMTSKEALFTFLTSYLTEEDAQAENTPAEYMVIVVNEQGQGIENAALQVCTDSMCQLFMTDADGRASIPADETSLELHILSLPEGYSVPEESWTLSPESPELTLTVQSL